MKPIILGIVFLLSFSLAAAVDINFNDGYSHGDRVQLAVTDCAGISIVRVINPNNQLIHIDQGTGNWQSTYNTDSDPNDGKYSATANCEDGTEAQGSFCVDQSDCLGTVAGTSDGSSGRIRGGSGHPCSSRWSCDVWSYCNNELVQLRTCFDRNKCSKNRFETRVCDKCQESWICTIWTPCQGNRQTRQCVDEHGCRTTVLKPHLQKSCTQAVAPGPQPVRVTPRLPGIPPVQQPAPVTVSFWGKYGNYVIGGGIALLVIIVAIVVVLLLPKKKTAYNKEELHTWVKKEKGMGTSIEDIRKILKQKTGWTKHEIQEAFQGLKNLF